MALKNDRVEQCLSLVGVKSKCGVVLLAVFCSDYKLSVPSEEILSDNNYLFGRFLVFSCECCSPVALLVVAVMTHFPAFASDQLVPWVFPLSRPPTQRDQLTVCSCGYKAVW